MIKNLAFLLWKRFYLYLVLGFFSLYKIRFVKSTPDSVLLVALLGDSHIWYSSLYVSIFISIGFTFLFFSLHIFQSFPLSLSLLFLSLFSLYRTLSISLSLFLDVSNYLFNQLNMSIYGIALSKWFLDQLSLKLCTIDANIIGAPKIAILDFFRDRDSWKTDNLREREQ